MNQDARPTIPAACAPDPEEAAVLAVLRWMPPLSPELTGEYARQVTTRVSRDMRAMREPETLPPPPHRSI